MNLSLLKNWWWLAINGLAAITFGLVALFYPSITLILLLAYFGMLALFLGAFFMLGGFLNRYKCDLWDFWFIEGILNGSIGLILLFYGKITQPMFQIIISIWAILLGAIQLISVFRLGTIVHQRGLYLINGLLALIFGILVITIPFFTLEQLTKFVGIYTMVLGVMSILIALSLKQLKLDNKNDSTTLYTYHHL